VAVLQIRSAPSTRQDPPRATRSLRIARPSGCCAGTRSCRWCRTSSSSRRSATAIIGGDCSSCCPTIPTSCNAFSRRRIAGRRSHEWQKERRVIQSDLRLWDYRHQVLATRLVPPWRLLLWLKATELAVQLRPRSPRRLAALPDPNGRAVMRWYYGVGKRVWPHEVWNFLFCEKRRRDGPTLREFWGPPLDAEEAAMRRVMAAGDILPRSGFATNTAMPAGSPLLRTTCWRADCCCAANRMRRRASIGIRKCRRMRDEGRA
jgi:hypothetical protein